MLELVSFQPVARKRWAASSSWGEILTFDSLSCLKAEKSLLFLLGATFFLVRLSAEEIQHRADKVIHYESNIQHKPELVFMYIY